MLVSQPDNLMFPKIFCLRLPSWLETYIFSPCRLRMGGSPDWKRKYGHCSPLFGRFELIVKYREVGTAISRSWFVACKCNLSVNTKMHLTDFNALFKTPVSGKPNQSREQCAYEALEILKQAWTGQPQWLDFGGVLKCIETSCDSTMFFIFDSKLQIPCCYYFAWPLVQADSWYLLITTKLQDVKTFHSQNAQNQPWRHRALGFFLAVYIVTLFYPSQPWSLSHAKWS